MSTVLKVNDITMRLRRGGGQTTSPCTWTRARSSPSRPNGAARPQLSTASPGVYEPTNGEVWFHDRLIASNHPAGKMKKLYAGENRGKYVSRCSSAEGLLRRAVRLPLSAEGAS